MITHRASNLAPPHIIEVVSFGFLFILFLLAAAGPSRVAQAEALARSILLVACAYGFGRWMVHMLAGSATAVALHIVAIMLLYSFLFSTSTLLQQSLSAQTYDGLIVTVDSRIFGSEASVWMQRFVHPLVTEWMMFAYVIYIPMLPILALVLWKTSGTRGVYDYLVNFVLVNVVCYAGFILVPVETAMWHHPDQFVVPLEGGFFTQCGEWVRANLHTRGGGMPSPHCAVATVMLIMIHRHWRKAFSIALPVVLTLYVATVYCRYHYIWDAVTGIGAGLLVVRWSPALIRLPERCVGLTGRVRYAILSGLHSEELSKEYKP
jgi:hypothetical protein